MKTARLNIATAISVGMLAAVTLPSEVDATTYVGSRTIDTVVVDFSVTTAIIYLTH